MNRSRLVRRELQVTLVLLLAGIAAISAQAAHAQTVNTQTLDALTTSLVQWSNSYAHAASGQRAALQSQLAAVAARRQQALSAAMEQNPGDVLRLALPDDVRNQMPGAARSMAEQRVALRGEVEVLVEDGRGYSQMHYGLRVAGQHLKLHFADKPPDNLLTGMAAQVKGVQLGEDVALTASGMTGNLLNTAPAGTTSSTTTTSSTSTSATSVPILPNTFGAQKTLVVLVNFQDNTSQPITVASAYSTTFTTVSNWFLHASYGQMWLTGDVAGWYTLPINSTCDTTSIQTYAQQAATSAGYVLSNYQRLIYVFTNSTCSYWGTSTIGGNPSQHWIDVNWGYASHVLTHELGHGLGLYHSHSLTCSGTFYTTSGCTSTEYGDAYDVMGVSNYSTYFYNAAQKERLGWLNYGASPPITTVTASGTFPIDPYESYPDANPKALKIPGPNGTYYYLESRQSSLEDSGIGSQVSSGLLLHNYGGSNSNYVLQAVPGVMWPLDLGYSDTDSSVGVTWSPASVTSTGAMVNVTFSTPTCTPTNPSFSLVGPAKSVAPGATANFTATITDNDSSACSSSTFNLAATIPSGWNAAYSANVVTLTPGNSASVTLAVTAPATTANGTYTVAATASNAAAATYSASASAGETIFTPPPVSVSVGTNSGNYSPGQTVSTSVTVMSGTAPLSGASVTVKLTKSNGSVVSLSATTGSNGVAVAAYKLKKSDPTGAWNSAGSSSNATANVGFTVN